MTRPHLFIVPPLVNIALPLATMLIAMWKGGWRERLLALVWSFGTTIPLLVRPAWSPAARGLHGTIGLATDTALLIAALICLRGAQRYWGVWVAAFALLSAVTDAVFLFVQTVSLMAFASADLIWGYCLEAVIIWASLTHSRPESRR